MVIDVKADVRLDDRVFDVVKMEHMRALVPLKEESERALRPTGDKEAQVWMFWHDGE